MRKRDAKARGTAGLGQGERAPGGRPARPAASALPRACSPRDKATDRLACVGACGGFSASGYCPPWMVGMAGGVDVATCRRRLYEEVVATMSSVPSDGWSWRYASPGAARGCVTTADVGLTSTAGRVRIVGALAISWEVKLARAKWKLGYPAQVSVPGVALDHIPLAKPDRHVSRHHFSATAGVPQSLPGGGITADRPKWLRRAI